MSRHTQEHNTNRDQRAPRRGEIYTNQHWVRVDECQAPYSEAERNPPASQGHYGPDEDGRQVWIDSTRSEH